MANLSNMEDNIQFQIRLKDIVEEDGIEYQTWICSELEMKSKAINCFLGEQNKFMLNKCELVNLLQNLDKLLACLKNGMDYSFAFSNYESNFELRMCTDIIDSIIEVEAWINWGNYTSGKEVGYDIGMRFVTDMERIILFLGALNEEINCLC